MATKQLISFIFRSFILGLIVAALILLLVPDLRRGAGFGDQWFSQTPKSATRETYYPSLSRSAPAVVNIYSVSIETSQNYYNRAPRQRTSLGSGVIMTESGYLLTCYHVIENADSIFVALQDNRIAEAELIGSDQLTDLAVLKVNETNLHVIPQLDETELRVGDVVMAIGNPYNLGQTITQGIVSRAGRAGLSNYVDFIQTDAVLNQGNSGGALVDSNGYLVGITNANFQIRDERGSSHIVDGINFAVPYELAKRVMEAIITNGKVTRGQLGFLGDELRGSQGIVVNLVYRNSPAAQAGLQAGDIIMAIDGIRLESATKTFDMIAETQPGTVLELEVSRNSTTLTMPVTVAERR